MHRYYNIQHLTSGNNGITLRNLDDTSTQNVCKCENQCVNKKIRWVIVISWNSLNYFGLFNVDTGMFYKAVQPTYSNYKHI